MTCTERNGAKNNKKVVYDIRDLLYARARHGVEEIRNLFGVQFSPVRLPNTFGVRSPLSYL